MECSGFNYLRCNLSSRVHKIEKRYHKNSVIYDVLKLERGRYPFNEFICNSIEKVGAPLEQDFLVPRLAASRKSLAMSSLYFLFFSLGHNSIEVVGTPFIATPLPSGKLQKPCRQAQDSSLQLSEVVGGLHSGQSDCKDSMSIKTEISSNITIFSDILFGRVQEFKLGMGYEGSV